MTMMGAGMTPGMDMHGSVGGILDGARSLSGCVRGGQESWLRTVLLVAALGIEAGNMLSLVGAEAKAEYVAARS